jgi:CRP/FNR family transcriptional regulator, anaerobic regulatory protein
MYGVRIPCETCPVRYSGICSALDNAALLQLGKIARRKSVKAHQVIFRDGDKADQYFNIVSGVVKLIKTLANGEQHIIGLLYPPDFMGQSLSRRHTYSAEAAAETEVCFYPRVQFEIFLRTHPELERRIFHMTIRELDACRDWTLLLGRKCSYQRVAGFLLMMARRVPVMGCGHSAGDSAHFQLPFTRSEMADYLGLTLETVSRQFSCLKKKRIIFLPSSREVIVPDIKLLSAVANIESCSGGFDENQNRAVA